MKTKKKAWVLLGLALLIINTSSAQNTELIETLNIEQIKLLDKSTQIMRENRMEINALLNEEQKTLLKDKSIARKERIIQLKSILSIDQLRTFEANREEDKESRKAFRRSLSIKQHTILKDAKKRGKHIPTNHIEKRQLLEKINERKKILRIVE